MGPVKSSGAAVLGLLLCVAGDVSDAWGATAEGPLEEIVVTATKTPGLELERTGIGASVLDRQTLEAQRIDSVGDLSDALVNLSAQRLGQVGGVFLTVRGIASNPFVANRVAVYVDDVPYRELNELLLTDLERVEFLRGPQSALYGLNPEAGAVVIRSASPGDTTQARAAIDHRTYRTGGSVAAARASLSGALTERLAGRISLAGSSGDAFTRNLGASDGREGSIDEAAVRGQLAVDVSARFCTPMGSTRAWP